MFYLTIWVDDMPLFSQLGICNTFIWLLPNIMSYIDENSIFRFVINLMENAIPFL
jgi:hypothetical protein